MPEHRPSPPDRKLTLVAPLALVAIVIVLAVVGYLMSRSRPAPAGTPRAAAPPTVAALPRPEPPLNRAELVTAANTAAADYASGGAPPPASAAMVGRRFSIRIPFGCEGPRVVASSAQASVEYDAARKTVTLAAQPAILTTLPLIQQLKDASKVEDAEGFWIPRPWSLSEACPPRRDIPAPATPTPPAAPTLGLVQLFEAGGSRVLRRDGRPYQHVRKVDQQEPTLLSHTYSLLLEGRIVGYGDGQAIHCWAESPDHRPLCLYAVAFDHVAFEDAESGKVLAEWAP